MVYLRILSCVLFCGMLLLGGIGFGNGRRPEHAESSAVGRMEGIAIRQQRNLPREYSCGRQEEVFRGKPADSLVGENQWVDSVYNALKLEGRIAQSFMLQAYSREGGEPNAEVLRLVEKHGVGGIIFFQGTVANEAAQTVAYQQAAKVPLLMAIDGEWGLGMRLADGASYPRAMALAATGEPQLAYRMGQQIARQMRRLGLHINFAPVVDVNTNPRNPVIGVRAFSDSPEVVAQFGLAYAQGMQQGGVLACAKHFPGHGSVSVDSHHALPFINRPVDSLNRIDLLPFKHLISHGIGMIMVGHLAIDWKGEAPGLSCSLNPGVLGTLLRNQLGYGGLICSDALNMGAVSNGKKPAEVALEAYQAGCDVLLCPQDVPTAIAKIAKAVRAGAIPMQRVEATCRRILRAKYRLIGPKCDLPNVEDVAQDLARPEYGNLAREITQHSLTLLNDSLVPILRPDRERIALVSYLEEERDGFAPTLLRYAQYTAVSGELAEGENADEQAAKRLGIHTLAIVAVQTTNALPEKNFGLSQEQMAFINACAKARPTILVLFGSPYALQYFTPPEKFAGVLVAYGAESYTRSFAAQALFGGCEVGGRLPVSVGGALPRGSGRDIIRQIRLGWRVADRSSIPENHYIEQADSLVRMAVDSGVMPGGQVLAVSRGQVFYSRSFGRYGYGESWPAVTDTTRYDIASLTKIAATVPMVMQAVEKKKWASRGSLGSTLPSTIRPR